MAVLVKLFLSFKVYFLVAAIAMLSVTGMVVAETRQQYSAAELGQILKGDPDNRKARWAFSQAAFRSGRYDIARYHILKLLRSSQSKEDTDTLTRALSRITAVDPWDFNVSFALLPSSNIRRYTFNDEFETNIGVFTPIGGGRAESGVGATFGASMAYALNLPDNSRLTLLSRIDHSVYNSSDLNQTRLLFALRWDAYAPGHATTTEPYLRFRFDEDLQLERRDIGVKVAREWWLKGSTQLRLSALLEDRDDLTTDALSGPYGRIDAHYSLLVDSNTRLGFGLSVAQSNPQAEHLKYREGKLSVEASRRFEKFGTLGLFGKIAARSYDGLFPATTMSRSDKTIALGVSYQPDRFKIMGVRPKLSCQIERNASNIALYDYKATDCGITFRRLF